MTAPFRFARGQLVWVRPLEEIEATLDAQGCLDGLPFMPEMARHCALPFRIDHRLTRTCVEGRGMRGIARTVFLEDLRCDGSLHDGCQRRCKLFWKEDWLSSLPVPPEARQACRGRALSSTRVRPAEAGRCVCQSTALLAATYELPSSRLWLHVRDLCVGELSPRQFALQLARGLGARLRRLAGLARDPQLRGASRSTADCSLGLRAGEWVEVKPREEIAETLDFEGRNRGLSFCPLMLAHCGHRYRVAGRIEHMIHEETGQMIHPRNTVLLEGVYCEPATCSRANPFYWREAWLRRCEAPPGAQAWLASEGP